MVHPVYKVSITNWKREVSIDFVKSRGMFCMLKPNLKIANIFPNNDTKFYICSNVKYILFLISNFITYFLYDYYLNFHNNPYILWRNCEILNLETILCIHLRYKEMFIQNVWMFVWIYICVLFCRVITTQNNKIYIVCLAALYCFPNYCLLRLIVGCIHIGKLQPHFK